MFSRKSDDPRSAKARKKRDLRRIPKELRTKRLSQIRRYCLYCFHTISGKGARCEHCQGLDIASDHRVFWNKNPRLIQLHARIRLASILLAAASIPLLLDYFVEPRTLLRLGYPFGFLILIELTNAKLLRHGWNFRADIVWPLMFLFWFPVNYWWFVEEGSVSRLPILVFAGTAILFGLVLFLIPKLTAWKEQLMQEGPTSE